MNTRDTCTITTQTTQMMTIKILTKKKVARKVLPQGALQDGRTHPWTFDSTLIILRFQDFGHLD